MRKGAFSVTLAAALLMATGSVAATPAAQPARSPADIYGPLFRDVQMARVFPDGKAFADAVPKTSAAAIMADYKKQRPQGPAALMAFVTARFDVPDVPAAPAMRSERPPLSDHIRDIWPVLQRPALKPAPGASALALPQPYIVPGGRFREIYYWDSYFTLLGARADGQDALVRNMIGNFESLIERYGRIPNGTRTYYLSRSQPPVFALMAAMSGDSDAKSQARLLKALKTEYGFWMAGAACAKQLGACQRVVRMPDGSLLNRYWDDRSTPRDESYAEDVSTATGTARPEAEVYRDLRAAAESGWDFSSRWLGSPGALSTIHTTDIVPVDLNSLLWQLESEIARRCVLARDTACATDFTARADARKAAMSRFLWRSDKNAFLDWNRVVQKPTGVLSAATLYPLFVGLADADQASAVAATTRARLVAPGGLRTTELATGQQWDSPNGWAPLQWIAVAGLSHYGQNILAHDIAARWITTVNQEYRASGRMLEKYDVETRRPGGGGEYPLQDGFGWTNGVTRALLASYPELDPDRKIP